MKDQDSFEYVKELFTEYLLKHHHRKTPERYAILERIFMYEQHFTVEMLYNQMKDSFRVSLATIYNTIDLLLECNLIVKHLLGGQLAQYEKVSGLNTHHHLICTRCGKVKEFSDKQIRTSIQSKQFAHFQLSHYSLYLYGLCSKCQAELKNQK